MSLSHIECTYDQNYYQQRELRKRYERDVAKRGVVLASRREAVPGRFTVGRLVLSLPSWGEKLEDEEFLFKRVHRIAHVRSHTDIRRGYEVCRVRPEFPTFDYKADKSIESRFLELISAEDYQAAEREFYKYMRRNLARNTISAEWDRSDHCDYDSIEDTIDSLFFPDDECRCIVCRNQRDRDSSYDYLYGPDPCPPGAKLFQMLPERRSDSAASTAGTSPQAGLCFRRFCAEVLFAMTSTVHALNAFDVAVDWHSQFTKVY